MYIRRSKMCIYHSFDEFVLFEMDLTSRVWFKLITLLVDEFFVT